MGRLRSNPHFEIMASYSERAETLKEYVVCAVDLMLNHPMLLEDVPIRYSPETGKPVQFTERAYRYWDGTLYTHAGFRGDIRVPDHIRAALEKRNKRPAIFGVLGKWFALSPHHASYNGGAVFAGYRIAEVDILE